MNKNSILNLFAYSPFKPLKKLALRVNECSELLEPFFEACFTEDWGKVAEVRKKIVDLEHKADNLKSEIRLKLPRGLFMPIDRGDLLDLINQLDKIANLTRQISGLVFGRKLVIPKSLQEEFKFFVAKSLNSTRHLRAILGQIDELLKFGFKGSKVKEVAQKIIELDNIESDADNLEVNLRHSLFNIEKELYAIDVMFLYKCIDLISSISDQVQSVGSRIELMIARA